ncbi:hypothetical protein R3P38DRAFT_2861781 [Favolaschia claudopus]|uniref:F-box domain-containing protein n=1 Tax=Favolaschia claudopus TaxID=2862362 RepID=A0AAW0DPC4_9AGAR
MSPLEIQELLDICIGLLSGGCTADLLACALVARSWVNAAQAGLFRIPIPLRPVTDFSYFSDSRASKFIYSLRSNPSLIRHVQELDVYVGESGKYAVHAQTFEDLCTVQFTHLKRFSLEIHASFDWHSTAVSGLVALPSLEYLNISTRDQTFGSLAHIWDCCSPTIRHLHIDCEEGGELPPSTGQTVCLKSLRLGVWSGTSPYEPRSRLLHPFDLSSLKAIGIQEGVSVPWNSINIGSIEVLDVNGIPDLDHVDPLDVVPLANLRILRIQLTHHYLDVSNLEFLGPIMEFSPYLHTIIIVVMNKFEEDEENEGIPENISALLALASGLVTRPLIELEYDYEDYTEDEARALVPNLTERDMLHFVGSSFERNRPEMERSWWRSVISEF